jgi:hypothetical protein
MRVQRHDRHRLSRLRSRALRRGRDREAQWVHELRESGLLDKYATRAIHSGRAAAGTGGSRALTPLRAREGATDSGAPAGSSMTPLHRPLDLNYMVAPRGAMRFEATTEVESSAEALSESAIDAAFYVRTEPRLVSARWRGPSPYEPGATIDVAVEIPFTVPAVREWLGPLVGVARLHVYDPPHRVAYIIRNARARGYLESSFEPVDDRTCVTVSAWLVVGFPTRLLMRPAAPLLQRLAAQAMIRGIHRADTALQSRVKL